MGSSLASLSVFLCGFPFDFPLTQWGHHLRDDLLGLLSHSGLFLLLRQQPLLLLHPSPWTFFCPSPSLSPSLFLVFLLNFRLCSNGRRLLLVHILLLGGLLLLRLRFGMPFLAQHVFVDFLLGRLGERLGSLCLSCLLGSPFLLPCCLFFMLLLSSLICSFWLLLFCGLLFFVPILFSSLTRRVEGFHILAEPVLLIHVKITRCGSYGPFQNSSSCL